MPLAALDRDVVVAFDWLPLVLRMGALTIVPATAPAALLLPLFCRLLCEPDVAVEPEVLPLLLLCAKAGEAAASASASSIGPYAGPYGRKTLRMVTVGSYRWLAKAGSARPPAVAWRC